MVMLMQMLQAHRTAAAPSSNRVHRRTELDRVQRLVVALLVLGFRSGAGVVLGSRRFRAAAAFVDGCETHNRNGTQTRTRNERKQTEKTEGGEMISG